MRKTKKSGSCMILREVVSCRSRFVLCRRWGGRRQSRAGSVDGNRGAVRCGADQIRSDLTEMENQEKALWTIQAKLEQAFFSPNQAGVDGI